MSYYIMSYVRFDGNQVYSKVHLYNLLFSDPQPQCKHDSVVPQKLNTFQSCLYVLRTWSGMEPYNFY